MNRPFLEIDQLTVVHTGAAHPAVREVSFDVSPGEVIAVLGSSGSGKSTLLRAIVGLVPVASGRIRLDGVDITTRPTHRRGIGLMFQDHALFPHLTVRENVGFGLRMAKMPVPQRNARIDDVLGLVGLNDLDSRDISSLSGGERQRVALARTLAPSPKLLLLDEPMGSLDRVLRDRLVPELTDIIEKLGLSVVYVTHDRDEAFALADRIAIMDEGALLQLASPAGLVAAPVSDHVSRLLGLG